MLEVLRTVPALGERLPSLDGQPVDGTPLLSQNLGGQVTVLLLCGREVDPAPLCQEFLPYRDRLAALGARVLLLLDDQAASRTGSETGFPVITCEMFLERCGVGPRETMTLLLDHELTILLKAETGDDAAIARQCLACLDAPSLRTQRDEQAVLAALVGRLAVGNRLPACAGVSSDRKFYASAQQYGRAAVLILASCRAAGALPPLLAALSACQEDLAARDADLLVITDDNPAGILAAGSTVRAVDGGDFLVRCGVASDQPRVVVVDRNLRVALNVTPAETSGVAQICLETLDALPREPARGVATPAPAIVLPNLLPHQVCRYLIEMFDASPTFEGGVARVDADGTVRNVVDQAKKRRRDLTIEPGTALHDALQAALLARLRPEVAKAFQGQVAHTDRILIARYDDTGGYFRRHRDNEADNVAFREFALSLNLNTGEYEGGELLFPEYNDHRHAPPAGGGVVFSSSVLHEAAPVTRGQRYVLLTFLHSEAAETRRLDWEAQAMTRARRARQPEAVSGEISPA